jgi:hypothetical protein
LRREALEEIELAKARWRLRFYRWGGILALGTATAQALDAFLALIEGRAPHLLFSISGLSPR